MPSAAADRIADVAAFNDEGERLTISEFGHHGFRIDNGGERWQLSYRLNIRPTEDVPTFYRTSVRGDDYLVLVGSDAWPRFYEDSSPLTDPVDMRPAGRVATARARFQLPGEREEWRVVTSAWDEGDGFHAMRSHPIASVFALGPFAVETAPGAHGLRVARHRDWDIRPDEITRITGDLLISHREAVPPAAGGRPLVLLSPLPPNHGVRGGLRTAGMVRNETLIVYADRQPEVMRGHPGIAEAMAVFLGHELFHLWVPSGVQVTRELSWLSEGWAMHMGRRAAIATGWLAEAGGERRLNQSYRRYLDIGGYRAGSLPEASLGDERSRNLLYLRGELVFQLLEREWLRQPREQSFENALWEALAAAYDGQEPLDAPAVRQILADLVEPTIVRRYVEGQAPLTPAALGLAGR